MPGIKIRLKPISETLNETGVFAGGKQLPVGHEITLPEGVTLEESGYGRHEVISGGTMADHEAVNSATSGTDGGGSAKDAGQIADGDDDGENPYIAEETSPGWWAIFKDGEQVSKKVRKGEVDDFLAADAETQAKYLDENKPAGEAV